MANFNIIVPVDAVSLCDKLKACSSETAQEALVRDAYGVQYMDHTDIVWAVAWAMYNGDEDRAEEWAYDLLIIRHLREVRDWDLYERDYVADFA